MTVDLDQPTADDPADLRTWQSRQFFAARIPILRGKLGPEQVLKFNAMPYHRKVWAIGKMIERGLMI